MFTVAVKFSPSETSVGFFTKTVVAIATTGISSVVEFIAPLSSVTVRDRSKTTYRSFNIYQIPITFLDKSNNSILDVKKGVSN